MIICDCTIQNENKGFSQAGPYRFVTLFKKIIELEVMVIQLAICTQPVHVIIVLEVIRSDRGL